MTKPKTPLQSPLMSDCIPLFKSHYSIGRSILTLNAPSENGDSSPRSIFDILIKNKIKEFFLVEDSMSGFLEAYVNSKENKIKLNFGLRLNFLCSIEEKNEEAVRDRCKYIIFAKNTNGYSGRELSCRLQRFAWSEPGVD